MDNIVRKLVIEDRIVRADNTKVIETKFYIDGSKVAKDIFLNFPTEDLSDYVMKWRLDSELFMKK